METDINVVATLKDKPQGVKLYSRICGAVELKEVLDVRKKKSIVVKELNSSNQHRFWYDGKFFRAGQCVLQPSKEMADWSKFSWKRGDVLVCKDVNSHIIFDKFNDDTYTTFTGKLNYQATKAGYSFAHTRNIAMTQDFDIEKGDAAQTYINTIEEKLGGKLNRETLEVEKQPEFKDGDILYCEGDSLHLPMTLILKTLPDKMQEYAYMNNETYDWLHICCDKTLDAGDISRLRYATEEEKQHLFNALAKKGKAWDAEKKEVIDLKPIVDELKPFDKVVVRCSEADRWSIDFFSYKAPNGYICTGDAWFGYCLPYNEETAKLIGTTKDMEV